ncbi:MAG: aminopeptidase P family protein [Spirochaetes bacterium]|nr:aminopeptidase P family protein [Spirochaetota bacterium]
MKRSSSPERIILTFKKISGLLITDLFSIRYFSGFTGSSAVILITPKYRYFLTDFRYKVQSGQEVKKGYKLIFYQKKLLDEIINIIKKERIKRLGIEERNIPYDLIRSIIDKTNIKPVDCSEELQIYRRLKSPEEVNSIRKALLCAEMSFQKVLPLIKPGISEKDVATELEYCMKKNGATGISFPIIVASGKRSALPHAHPTNKKIRPNDLVIIDFGANINGYNSDTTVTIKLGKTNNLLNEAYRTVRKSIDLALSMIKVNTKTSDIDRKIHEFIIARGFKDGLIHSLGHGVGLDIHESPTISRNKDDFFQKGMVFTIEPGIYIENIGGVRIEVMAHLSDKGVKILNSPSFNNNFLT